jgi:hypothetical protein
MSSDKVNFLFATLDYHLSRDVPVLKALEMTLEDYKHVYVVYPDDGRSSLNRAAERALIRMGTPNETPD